MEPPVILMDNENDKWPTFTGLKEAANYKNTDFKIFGKPNFVCIEEWELPYPMEQKIVLN